MKDIFNLRINEEWGTLSSNKSWWSYNRNAGFVKRLALSTILDGHDGCVNTINWNATGTKLISGSDDCQICLWDYPNKTPTHKWRSGHTSNIFCTRFMPATNDETVISCARDTSVRIHTITPASAINTRSYFCHADEVKKVAVEADNPHTFLTCSEDGTVRLFDLRAKHDCSPTEIGPTSPCLSNVVVKIDSEIFSISINPSTPSLFAIGGGDKYVRVYDSRMIRRINANGPELFRCVKRYWPEGCRGSQITAVKFSNDGRQLLASYSMEYIYMFNTQDINGSPDLPINEPIIQKSIHSTSTEEPKLITACRKAEIAYSQYNYSMAVQNYSLALSYCGVRQFMTLLRSCLLDNRAACYVRLGRGIGDLSSAERDCALANKLDPNNRKALVRRATIQWARGEGRMALIHARTATNGITEDKDGLRQLATDLVSDLVLKVNGITSEIESDDSDNEVTNDNESNTCRCQGISRGGCSCTNQWEPSLGLTLVADWPTGLTELANSTETYRDDDDDEVMGGVEVVEGEGEGEGEGDEEDREGEGMEVVEAGEGYGSAQEEEEDDDDDDVIETVQDSELIGGSLGSTNETSSSEEEDADGDSDDVDGTMRGLDNYMSNSEQSSSDIAPIQKNYITFYSGHCNIRTVKDVNFFGPNSEYVLSGSDDGHVMIWDKDTGRLVNAIVGDGEIVNQMMGHPLLPVLACSGIDSTIKIFEPIASKPAVLNKVMQVGEENERVRENGNRGQRFLTRAMLRQMVQHMGE
eukprot:Ihof_evm1s280 gene=Ihof_evmTU1s280